MSASPPTLPQLSGGLFLAYVGMETDLIFTKGIDLPGFASYPLLESEDGRALLSEYLENIIQLAKKAGSGVILESPTWVANRDRGADIGYAPDTLQALNVQSIAMMADARAKHPDVQCLISANVGPRADAYAPSDQMSAEEAQAYHSEQIGAVAGTEVDLISGYTLAYANEAIGIVKAAKQHDLPVIIAFTVETDGRLPTGSTLKDAIKEVDAATNGYASYYMINCAHPDHFGQVLTNEPWMNRLKGLVANASRCSHAELDEAEELDDGNPEEFGAQLAALREKHPNITVLGGCCGTDMRHMQSIVDAS